MAFRTAVIPNGYRRHLEPIPPVGALLVSACLRVSRVRSAVLPGVVLPHVDVARGHPDGVVDDAAHDGIGLHAATQARVPVVLAELRAEDDGALHVLPLRYLEQEDAELLGGFGEQSLVEEQTPPRPSTASSPRPR